MRSLLSALVCSLFVFVNAPFSSRADGVDATIAAATDVVAQPSAFNLAAPRPAGEFVYGTHLAAVDHAALASQDGFRLMWGLYPLATG